MPAFCLRRFANQRGQLWVRDRRARKPGPTNVNNLGTRNFNTFINDKGQPDGRIEQLLNKVETEASIAIRRVTSPLLAAAPMTDEEKQYIAMLVAFQLVRGPRKRREIELMGDLYARINIAGRATPDELRRDANLRQVWEHIDEIEFQPSSNEHLQLMSPLAMKLFSRLLDRPFTIVELTEGSLLTCDDPVVIEIDDWQRCEGELVRDLPVKSSKRGRRRNNKARRREQLIHFQPSTPRGIDLAQEVWMPIGRRSILLLGPKGTAAEHFVRLDKDDSLDCIEYANDRLISQAYFTVMSHPDDLHLLDKELPPVGPLFHVCGATHKQAVALTRQNPSLAPHVFGRK